MIHARGDSGLGNANDAHSITEYQVRVLSFTEGPLFFFIKNLFPFKYYTKGS